MQLFWQYKRKGYLIGGSEWKHQIILQTQIVIQSVS